MPTGQRSVSAKAAPKLSNEAAILQVLHSLPEPGGKSVCYRDLNSLRSTHCGIDWESLPSSCDPIFVLDNPANNIRRKGTLEQQLSQMVLGRQGEGAYTPETATTAQASKRSRGTIKRWQVESFAVVLRHLLEDAGRPLHLVDFGCGTGTLLLPLAALFPHCRFTGVEMKPAAVALLLERARAAGLSNVEAVRGMIEEFVEQPFDVALALHACGNATDAAMQLAARRRAAYVVSPCCVGKLKFSLAGGSSFSASLLTYTPRMPGDRPPPRQVHGAAGSGDKASSGAGPGAGPRLTSGSPEAPLEDPCPAGGAGGPLAAAAPVSRAAEEEAAPAVFREAAATTVVAACADEGGTGEVSPSGGKATADLPPPESAGTAGAAGAPAVTLPGTPAVADAEAPAGAAGQAASSAAGQQQCTAAAAAATAGGPTTRAVVLGEVRHPRSAWMREHLPQPETHFRIMAKVADQNHSAVVAEAAGEPEDASTGLAAAAARACKAHVELDRNLAAKEDGYAVGMFKCFHWQEMAKNDLLVGVPMERGEWGKFASQVELAPPM